MMDEKTRKEILAHEGHVDVFINIEDLTQAWGTSLTELGMEAASVEETVRFRRVEPNRWHLERDPEDRQIWEHHISVEDDDVWALTPKWVELLAW